MLQTPPRDIVIDDGLSSAFWWFVVASVALHAVFFYFTLVVLPDIWPEKRGLPPMYTVNLVTLPPGSPAASPEPEPEALQMPKFEPLPEPDAGEAPEVKYEPPKPPRIEAPEPEIEAPAALGEIKAPEPEIEKVETPPPAEKPKVDPDKALNDALAKVKRRVRRKQTSESHVEDALASLRKKVAGGSAGAGGPRGAVSELDARMRDYYLVLYNRMSSNWVMPPGVKDRNIEAVYVISIDRSGRITRGWFERESGNALFDQSVERAVAKSNPLQPLPDVYKGSTHEVGLRFTPAGVRRR